MGDRSKSTLDIVALVESTRHFFRQRSWELTLHARSAKTLCSAQTHKLKLGQKAEVKVNNFNDNVAVRHSEVINLTVVNKRDIVKGRGQYKSWTPNAVMRACFEVASLPLQGTGTKLVKQCKLKKGRLRCRRKHMGISPNLLQGICRSFEMGWPRFCGPSHRRPTALVVPHCLNISYMKCLLTRQLKIWWSMVTRAHNTS